jgi:hypothetical protein
MKDNVVFSVVVFTLFYVLTTMASEEVEVVIGPAGPMGPPCDSALIRRVDALENQVVILLQHMQMVKQDQDRARMAKEDVDWEFDENGKFVLSIDIPSILKEEDK